MIHISKKKRVRQYCIAFAIIYVFVLYISIRCAPYFEESGGLLYLVQHFDEIYLKPFNIRYSSETVKTVLILSVIYILIAAYFLSEIKNYRRGEENGSAEWGDSKEIGQKYIDNENNLNNKLMSENFAISLNVRKHLRNLNTVIVGGSGAGKTRYYALPNIMQANASYVILDPKGELLRATGNFLKDEGYDVKVLNLKDADKSMGYNPISYVKSPGDLIKTVDILIRSTNNKKAGAASDQFWEKAEKLFIESMIFFLLEEAPDYEQNFPMVTDLLVEAQAREDNEDYVSIVDAFFEELEAKNPSSIAVKYYKQYKLAAGKTAKSILISVAARLERINIPEIRTLMSYDEMKIEDIGRKKCAIYCVIPDNDEAFNFIVSMLYTQLFQILGNQADTNDSQKLDVPVHFLMDEFANVALPDSFDKAVSTMRSRGMYVSIILQNMAQIKALYEKEWESIVGNCDEFLYLGGNEQSSHKYVSEMLGKETIDTNSYGKSKGKSGSFSTNYQNAGRELMLPNELRELDNKYCVLFVRGEKPIIDYKYNLKKHPNYKKTALDGKAPEFTYERSLEVSDWDAKKLSDKVNYTVMDSDEIYKLLNENESEN